LAPFGSDVAIGGPAVYAVTLDEVSQQRMPLVMAAVTATGLIALRLLIGSLRAAAAGIAAITLSQVVLLGGLSWSGRALDMSLMMVPPLMMSLGVSYVAHRAVGKGSRGVLTLCALTTAAGIGSFVLTPLPPIRSFAVVGMVGLALTWLAVVTLVPRAGERRLGWSVPGLRFAVAARGQPAVMLTAAAFVFAALPLLAPRLRFVADPLTYFPPEHPTARDFATLDRRLTGMLPFQVVASDAGARELLERTPGVRKVIPIPTVLAGGARAYWCLANNIALPKLAAAQPEWERWAASRGSRIQWRGVAAQLHAAEQVLRRISVGSLAGMTAVAAGAVALRTRRSALAVLAALLTLLPVAALVELTVLLKVPVSLVSLMIGSISVGVAVDDVLHITCESGSRGSIVRGMTSCWRGCVGSSVINVVCLSCFALSPFGPTRQFGLLMATAAVLAAASNQLVLPALLALDRNHSAKSAVRPVPAPFLSETKDCQVVPELP
jgi:predicted RND superfamily exporter protein